MSAIEIKIEKSVPVPMQHGGYSAILRKLKKGESAVLPIPTINVCSLAYKIFGAGKYVACRKVEGGTRVWRIK